MKGRQRANEWSAMADERALLRIHSRACAAVLWPWTGYLALSLRVVPAGADAAGVAEGVVTLTVTSPPAPEDPSDPAPPLLSTVGTGGAGGAGGPGAAKKWRTSEVRIPVKATIVKQPPRQKRVLWDMFHSIRYPPGYVPRDNLEMRQARSVPVAAPYGGARLCPPICSAVSCVSCVFYCRYRRLRLLLT